MAKFSNEDVEQIVTEHLGTQRKVKRVEETPPHDELQAKPDLGTPGLEAVHSKYLAPWRDIYESVDEALPEINYEAGDGDDLEDEIVQVPVSDDDESGPTKSFVISGDKQKIIGTQG
jgi:hypothetical protein